MKLFTFLFLITAALSSASSVYADDPNIIYILTDDLGYGDVQCLNPERGKIPTPHMNKLAAEGMYFSDAHSSSAVCTPTRYSILTGRYNWRTRLQKGVTQGFSKPLISKGRLTHVAAHADFCLTGIHGQKSAWKLWRLCDANGRRHWSDHQRHRRI